MKSMVLKDWRIKKAKESKDVALAVGLSLPGYINIEAGRRGPSRLMAMKIAEYLSVRQEQIIWPFDVSECNTDTATGTGD